MQVVCATCQLSFDAPEGATGLVCPICRGPLRPQAAAGAEGDGASKKAQDWSGGDLDDLIALLSAPAVSARVEVLGATGDAVIGEVHLLAGGVSDSIYQGKATDDALDRLREDKPTRFRVEQRLPNPNDGNLSEPGPETGTLDGRALAHLMRYCEDYVISCAIDVWRGNETARVEYRRGEISGVTVGGIDAPERLAEVMQWSSGNYRLVVPEFKLPASAPKRAKSASATPAPVPAPAPSAQAARNASSTKTIFGMPVAEVAKARAAAEASKEASKTAAEAARPGNQSGAPRVATPVPVATPAPGAQRVAPPSATPAPAPAPAARARADDGFARQRHQDHLRRTGAARPRGVLARATRLGAGRPRRVRRRGFGAHRDRQGRLQDGRAQGRRPHARGRCSDDGSDHASGRSAPSSVRARRRSQRGAERAATNDRAGNRSPGSRTQAARAGTAPVEKQPRQQTKIWTYVGVGFAFGLVLLGIYQLYGLLAH